MGRVSPLPATFLAGPTIQQRGSRVCVAAKIEVRFTASPVATAISWQPSGELHCGCSAERDRWNQRVISHECEHVVDMMAAVADPRYRIRKNYRECKENEQAANQAIIDRVLRDSSAVRKRIEARIQRDGDKFDDEERQLKVGAPPDCKKCPDCGSGQCPCPGGQCCEAGRCTECCPVSQQCGELCCPAWQQCCSGSCATNCISCPAGYEAVAYNGTTGAECCCPVGYGRPTGTHWSCESPTSPCQWVP